MSDDLLLESVAGYLYEVYTLGSVCNGSLFPVWEFAYPEDRERWMNEARKLIEKIRRRACKQEESWAVK